MVCQGRGVEEEYRKVVCSIYWACKAVGNGSLVADADPECVAGLVKDLNCVAWRLKLTGKAEAILKELLVEEQEEPQVAIESWEIQEKDIDERIKKDMEQLPEDKRKELQQHVQGIIRANTMAYRYAVEAADHLGDASTLMSMLGIVVLAQATARPLIGVHMPLMTTFLEEAKQKREEEQEKRKQEMRPIDEICIEQNLPRLATEWWYQHEGEVNKRLAAITTRYVHAAMMRDKKQFYSRTVLGRMFDVPPSTLNKLISGQLYMGGAELEKYRDELERKGVTIKKRRNTKVGGRRTSEPPNPSTSSA